MSILGLETENVQEDVDELWLLRGGEHDGVAMDHRPIVSREAAVYGEGEDVVVRVVVNPEFFVDIDDGQGDPATLQR